MPAVMTSGRTARERRSTESGRRGGGGGVHFDDAVETQALAPPQPAAAAAAAGNPEDDDASPFQRSQSGRFLGMRGRSQTEDTTAQDIFQRLKEDEERRKGKLWFRIMSFTFNPQNLTRKAWDMFMMVLVLYSGAAAPCVPLAAAAPGRAESERRCPQVQGCLHAGGGGERRHG